jgi:hypothetical protein
MFVEEEDKKEEEEEEEAPPGDLAVAQAAGDDVHQAQDQRQQRGSGHAAGSGGQQGSGAALGAFAAVCATAPNAACAAAGCGQRRVVVMKQWGINLATGETATQQVAGVLQGDLPPPAARPARAGRHYAFWR